MVHIPRELDQHPSTVGEPPEAGRPAPLVTEVAVSSPGASIRRRRDGGYTVALAGAVDFELVPDAFRHFRAYLPAYGVNRGTLRLRLTSAFLRELAAPRRWAPDQVTPFERTRVLDPSPDRAVLKRALDGAVRLFPQLAGIEMLESWAGMIDTMPDALPVMDALDRPEGYFIATGFSGHGFGMGPGAGLFMSELATEGRARVDLRPFRLSRFSDGSRPRPYTAF